MRNKRNTSKSNISKRNYNSCKNICESNSVKQKVLLGVLAVGIACTMIGCTEKEQNVDLTPEAGYLIMEDDLGTPIKVKEDPEYVSALFAVTTHYMAVLDDLDSVVSISEGNTRDFLFCEMFPSVLEKKVVKGNNNINMESMVSKPVPELLVANPEAFVDENTTDKLKKLGIPIYIASFGTFEEQMESVTKLADIMNKESQAQVYVDYYAEMITFVKERIATIPETERKTAYHAINELLRTDKEGTISKEVMKAAGAKNIADTIQQKEELTLTSKSYIAVEELMQANPEYIFINGADVYDYIEQNEQFHSLQAYQNKKIFLLPLGVSRWGHPNSIETPLAVLFVAKAMYPELFEDVVLEEEIREFYTQMFRYELSDEQVENILEGRVYKEIKGAG